MRYSFQTIEEVKTYERNQNYIYIYRINEEKVKLSQYLIQQCAMKMCGEVGVYLFSLLAMALFVGQWVAVPLWCAFFKIFMLNSLGIICL